MPCFQLLGGLVNPSTFKFITINELENQEILIKHTPTYTYVVEKRYMSEIRNYKKLSLGETENLFINIFSTPNYSYSAYEIFSILKKSPRPMAYKNVHKRVKRLDTLGLIREVEKSQRNAIKYELTTRGLFERLLIPNVDLTFLERNKESVILQNILFRFFEEITIHEIGEAMKYLRIYLHNSCYAILTLAETQKPKLDELDKEYEQWKETWFKGKLEPNWNEFYGSYSDKMEDLIMGQIKNFIIRIVESTKFEYLDRKHLKKEPREYLNPFPSELLRSDVKFIPILKDMKNDFNDGCKILLSKK